MLQYPYPIPQKLVAPHVEKIQFLSKVLDTVPVSTLLRQTVFHRQVLKSSLFSARIEGNNLTLADMNTQQSQEDLKKKEVDNCMKALRMVHTLGSALTLENLKEIHGVVMEGLHREAGHFRSEQSAIFDSAGNVVYLTPDRTSMEQMLELWLFEANKQRSDMTEHLIDSARLHYYFEKIHPFFDGNGRTGRVLLQWQLAQTKAFGSYILPIDEYFESARSAYYAYLERNTRHMEEFTSFVLEGVSWSLDTILTDLKKTVNEPASTQPSVSSPVGSPLLPRREEIRSIIADHPLSSLDMIARRFPTIPPRTLSFDVQWLVKHGYVVKHGSTRGVRYSVAQTTSQATQ